MTQQTTDIASVLRDYLDGNPDARGQVEFVEASDLRDAASEIDRLRAERDEARQCLAILQADFEDAIADQKETRSAR